MRFPHDKGRYDGSIAAEIARPRSAQPGHWHITTKGPPYHAKLKFKLRHYPAMAPLTFCSFYVLITGRGKSAKFSSVCCQPWTGRPADFQQMQVKRKVTGKFIACCSVCNTDGRQALSRRGASADRGKAFALPLTPGRFSTG
jgi:hypothetical protein